MSVKGGPLAGRWVEPPSTLADRASTGRTAMPMGSAGVRQEPSGGHRYVFRSPTATNRCLVLAHACWSISTRKFIVPAAADLYFMVPHDTNLRNPSIEEMIEKAPTSDVYHVRPGELCWD